MPELPEVETVRRQLQTKIKNQVIAEVLVYSAKQTGNDPNFDKVLPGKTFNDVSRIGKLLIFTFIDQSDLFLLGHLKMTGQLLYVDYENKITGGGHTMTNADLNLPGPHTRVQLNFISGDRLYFNDMRKFGYLKIVNKQNLDEALTKYGPEPNSENFNCDKFYQDLQMSRQPIKAFLLDQKRVAGLGNIYVDEALWRSLINPSKPANQVSKTKAVTLCTAMRDVLNESIAQGGTTFRNYTDTSGKSGNFMDYLQVFDRTGEKCQRCQNKIKKIKLRGRGTHFCPTCQA